MRGKQKGAPLTASNAAAKKRKRPVCKVEGCTNIVQNGGVCFNHGATRKGCSHEGCGNKVYSKGVCKTHGAKVKRYICKEEGCNNNVVKDGVCVRHGAKLKRCSHEGCTNQALVGGVCKKHGAEVKKCKQEGCTNKAHVGGICISHGAKRKRCSREGCNNQAVKGGVCCRHGAKVKRCIEEGCTKQAQGGGLCCRHRKKRKLDGVEHDSSANDMDDDDDGTQEVPGLDSGIIVDDVVNGGPDVDAHSDADRDESRESNNESEDGEEQRLIEGSDSEEELDALTSRNSVPREIRNGRLNMNAPASVTCEEDNNSNNGEATKHDQGKEDEENPSPAKLSIVSGGETYANNENHKCSNGDEHGNSEERSDEMIPSEESSDPSLSPYEQLRLDKIAPNNDKLRELGLDKPITQAAKQMSKRKKKKVTTEIERRVQPSRPAKAKLKKNVYNDEDEMSEASQEKVSIDKEDMVLDDCAGGHGVNATASTTHDENNNCNGKEANEEDNGERYDETPSPVQEAGLELANQFDDEDVMTSDRTSGHDSKQFHWIIHFCAFVVAIAVSTTFVHRSTSNAETVAIDSVHESNVNIIIIQGEHAHDFSISSCLPPQARDSNVKEENASNAGIDPITSLGGGKDDINEDAKNNPDNVEGMTACEHDNGDNYGCKNEKHSSLFKLDESNDEKKTLLWMRSLHWLWQN